MREAAQRREVLVLADPPEDEVHRRGEARQRDKRRRDVRRLRVVDVEHPRNTRDLLEPVLDPGEAAQRRPHRIGLDPARERDRRRRRRVEAVVRATQADLVVRDQRLLVPPQIARAVVELAAGPERHAPRAAAEVVHGQIHRRDRDIVVALACEHPQLRAGVVLERAVAVEVVGLQVEQDRALGCEVDGVLELKRAALADDDRLRREAPARRTRSAHRRRCPRPRPPAPLRGGCGRAARP